VDVYRNLIDGAWVESASPRRVPNTNPADVSDVLGETPLSTTAEAAAAVAAAEAAAASWRQTPAGERGALVARAAGLMIAREAEFAAVVGREQGMLPREALAEARRAAALTAALAGLGPGAGGRALPVASLDSFGYTARQPLGAVALATSWMNPASDPALALAAALLAGNTAVLKPAALTPATAELVARCFVDAGVPAGVLNLVHGDAELAAALARQEAIQALYHTGGPAGGALLRAIAAERAIPARLEGAGGGVALVMEDADLDLALAGVAAGAFGHAGQRRGATSRAVLMHPVADAFLEKLVGVCGRVRPGGADEGADIGPLVSAERLEAALAGVAAARAAGAELLCGGARAGERGYFMRPTVLDRCRPEMGLAGGPALAPVLAVTRVESFEEALAVAGAPGRCDTAALYTRDASRVFRFAEEIEAAVVQVNVRAPGEEAPDMDELLAFFSRPKAVRVEY
jgi:aldehyde dehydrogenase (NAD+)